MPWRGVAIGVAFCAGLSFLLAHLAQRASGAVWLGLITVSAMLMALSVIGVIRRLLIHRVLELTETTILLPTGLLRVRPKPILYSDIIRIQELAAGSRRELLLETGGRGLPSAIQAVCLPDIESYQAVKDHVCSRVSVVMPRADEQTVSTCSAGGFPEPILHWVEPEHWPRYRTHLVVSSPLTPRLRKAIWFFVRCFGVILCPWLLLWSCDLLPLPTTAFLWLAILVGLFFTSLHWLNVVEPVRATEISFRDRGLTQISGKQICDLSYRDCSGWTVTERQYEQRVLYILLLKWRTHLIEVALPDSDTRDRLMELLRAKQIPNLPELQPSWEPHSSV